MKKFLSFFAAALLLASCSNDDFTPSGVEGQEEEVTISFQVPGDLQSRATLAGASNQGGVSNLDGQELTFNVALYYQGDQDAANATPAWVGTAKGAQKVTFNPTLVIGKKYRIVAYAAYNDVAWDVANGAVNANVLAEINNEAKDAYYCDNTVTAEAFMSATLYRPYGKLRIVTTDWEEALNQFNTDGIKEITVTYANAVETQFNPLTGEFESTASYASTASTINEYTEADGQKTLVVDYLPASVEGASLYNFTVAVEFNNGEEFSREFNMDVPVKRNYVTTLIGDFFTSTAQLDVEVDDAFTNEDITDMGLYYAFQDGGSYTLKENVTLSKTLTLAAGKTLNLDLGGYTITLETNGDNVVDEIVNNGTLNLSNGKIVAASADVENRRCVYNYGTMTIDGVEFTQLCDSKGAAINNEGTMTIKDATVNAVYYSIWNSGENTELTIEGGKYTTTNVVEKDKHAYAVNNQNGAKLTINGGEFEGNHGVIGATTNSLATLNGGKFYCNAGFSGNSDWTLYANNATILYSSACEITSENPSGVKTTENNGVIAEMATVEGGDLATTLAALAGQESAVITLDGEVTWETGASHGSTPWIAADATLKNLVVDGKGTASLVATGAGVGSIRAANGGTITFKNLKIVDNSVSYAEDSWEFTYLEFAGVLKFENCEFVNAIQLQTESSEAVLNAEFVNCTFNSNKENEYDVWVSDGTTSFKGCKFLGYRGLKMHEDYGSEIVKVVADGNTFGPLSKKPGIAIGDLNADTEVQIINNTFTGCQPGDQGLYIYESDTDVTTFTLTLSNNKIYDANGAAIITPEAPVVENGVAKISTAAQLLGFNSLAAADRVSVELTADIDLEGATISSIVLANGGTFDGKGYAIKNANVTYSDQYAVGLFAPYVSGDLTIKNVNIVNPVVKTTLNEHGYAGVLVGACDNMNSLTVENVHISGAEVCGVSNVGGFVGYSVFAITIKNSSIKDSKVTNQSYANESGNVGGIVGRLNGANLTMESVEMENVTIDAYYAARRGESCINEVVGNVVGTPTITGEPTKINVSVKKTQID